MIKILFEIFLLTSLSINIMKIIKLSYLFNINLEYFMNISWKILYIITEYILIYFDIFWYVILNVFTNLIQKGTLCDKNYIFGNQEIEGKQNDLASLVTIAIMSWGHKKFLFWILNTIYVKCNSFTSYHDYSCCRYQFP